MPERLKHERYLELYKALATSYRLGMFDWLLKHEGALYRRICEQEDRLDGMWDRCSMYDFQRQIKVLRVVYIRAFAAYFAAMNKNKQGRLKLLN